MKLLQTKFKEKYNNNYYYYLKKQKEKKLSTTLICLLENEFEFLNFRISRWLYYNQNIIKYLFDIGYMGDLYTSEYWFQDVNKNLFLKKYIIPIINNINIPKLANSYFGLQILSNTRIKNSISKNDRVAFFIIITDAFIDNNNNIDIPTYNKDFFEEYFKIIIDTYYIKWIFSNYNKIIQKNNYFEINNEFKSDKTYNKIYIRYTSGNNYQKNKDVLFFGINLLSIKHSLDLLEVNGDLIIRDTIPSYLFKIQLYYILSSLFKSYIVVHETKDLYITIRFINLKKKTNIFTVLYNEYEKYDLSLGKKYLNNYNVDFDFNISIDKNFMSVFDNYKLKQKEFLKLKLKRLEYIKKKLNENPNYLKKILHFNIYKSLSRAQELGLNINPYYKKDFFKLSDVNKKKHFFPKADIDYKKLQYDYETTFSMTDEITADIITNIIKLKYPNTKIIADMTANVGGNTLNFAKYFDKVYSVEIDKNTFDMLNNNIKVYGYKNVETFHDDANNFKKLADMYFYDPPWTGILYQRFEKLDLFLGDFNIIDMMNYNFCLKAPLNYNINNLLSKYKNISIYKLKNYLIIINNTNNCKNCIPKNKLLNIKN